MAAEMTAMQTNGATRDAAISAPSGSALRAADIADVVRQHLSSLASELRPDVLDALKCARREESCEQAATVLDMLIENAELAARTKVPLCQDTGSVWVLVEMGSKARVELTGLQDALDEVVESSFKEQYLRASTVIDALSKRTNPGTNTPAFVDIIQHKSKHVESDCEVQVHTMLKGAGSDNSSRVAMLSPTDGEEGIVQLVLDTVINKGSIACPPMIIGIGIGGTFDKAASLSKRALLRPFDQKASQAEGQTAGRAMGQAGDHATNQLVATGATARLEQRILDAVNATGIGPAGLGGDTTALSVQIETAPSHIASLPVAINLMCCALRSRSSILPT